MLFLGCEVQEAVVIGPDKDSDEASFMKVFHEDRLGFRPFPIIWAGNDHRKPVLMLHIEQDGTPGTLTLFTKKWTIVDGQDSRGFWELQLFDGDHLKAPRESNWVQVADEIGAYKDAIKLLEAADVAVVRVTKEETKELIKGHWAPPWYVKDDAIRHIHRDLLRTMPRSTRPEELQLLAEQAYQVNLGKAVLSELEFNGVTYRIWPRNPDNQCPYWHTAGSRKAIFFEEAYETGLFAAWLEALEEALGTES